MDAIAQTACELLKRGEALILATIVSQSGATPRTAGSQMIVTADGRGIGTIGGGLLEAGTMSRAMGLIERKESAILDLPTTPGPRDRCRFAYHVSCLGRDTPMQIRADWAGKVYSVGMRHTNGHNASRTCPP